MHSHCLWRSDCGAEASQREGYGDETRGRPAEGTVSIRRSGPIGPVQSADRRKLSGVDVSVLFGGRRCGPEPPAGDSTDSATNNTRRQFGWPAVRSHTPPNSVHSSPLFRNCTVRPFLKRCLFVPTTRPQCLQLVDRVVRRRQRLQSKSLPPCARVDGVPGCRCSQAALCPPSVRGRHGWSLSATWGPHSAVECSGQSAQTHRPRTCTRDRRDPVRPLPPTTYPGKGLRPGDAAGLYGVGGL